MLREAPRRALPCLAGCQLCSLGWGRGVAGGEGTPRPPDPGNQALVRGEGWLGGSEEHLGKFGSFVCDCLLKAQRGLCASRRCSVASARSEVEMPPASRPRSSPAETDSGELWEENLIILSPLTIDLGTGPAGAFVWDACPAAFLIFGVDL